MTHLPLDGPPIPCVAAKREECEVVPHAVGEMDPLLDIGKVPTVRPFVFANPSFKIVYSGCKALFLEKRRVCNHLDNPVPCTAFKVAEENSYRISFSPIVGMISAS